MMQVIDTVLLIFLALLVTGFLLYKVYKGELKNTYKQDKLNRLSFEQINIIIDTVFTQVKTKYLTVYMLKEYALIPDLNEEAKKITHDVIDALSTDVFNQCLHYYSKEYLISLIVNRAQDFLIQYVNDNRPK